MSICCHGDRDRWTSYICYHGNPKLPSETCGLNSRMAAESFFFPLYFKANVCLFYLGFFFSTNFKFLLLLRRNGLTTSSQEVLLLTQRGSKGSSDDLVCSKLCSCLFVAELWLSLVKKKKKRTDESNQSEPPCRSFSAVQPDRRFTSWGSDVHSAEQEVGRAVSKQVSTTMTQQNSNEQRLEDLTSEPAPQTGSTRSGRQMFKRTAAAAGNMGRSKAAAPSPVHQLHLAAPNPVSPSRDQQRQRDIPAETSSRTQSGHTQQKQIRWRTHKHGDTEPPEGHGTARRVFGTCSDSGSVLASPGTSWLVSVSPWREEPGHCWTLEAVLNSDA